LLKKINVPAIFITHDQEEALDLGDRIAVLNVGHVEQIGTPHEVYNNPATEYVATFVGAANVLNGTVRGGRIEIGSCLIAAQLDPQRFVEGQAVKLVFRPEDVALSPVGSVERPGHQRVSEGVIEEMHFLGAHERVSLRLDLAPAPLPENSDSYYLTTETQDMPAPKPIIATRAKPEAAALRLRPRDRVVVSLTSFTVLPV
jgi:ABC-type Fe3+/spermidine/putrescine transport system ATPase subunit